MRQSDLPHFYIAEKLDCILMFFFGFLLQTGNEYYIMWFKEDKRLYREANVLLFFSDEGGKDEDSNKKRRQRSQF